MVFSFIKNINLFFALITCFLVGITPAKLLADPELPLLGENASLNLHREVELGRGLFNTLTAKGYVVEDLLLSRYIQDIGESLLTSLDVRFREYRFFLVKDGSVNAFAAPGGYIGINLGLISIANSVDELASVLAHEIAHVELMHSMQMLEKARAVNMAGMISVLAAILLSSQDPEAASAIIYTGVAGGTQTMINFTRENEYEADRVGVEILKKSEYTPSAMVDFLKILQSREQSGELSGIEYLRTHPVNANRIAEVSSRNSNAQAKKTATTRFQQFKDYLFYLYPDEFSDETQSRFSFALLHTRNGRYQIADKLYRELLNADPDSLWLNYALAENMEYQSRFIDASRLYRSLLLLYPEDLAIASRQVHVLQLMGMLQEALQLSLQLLHSHADRPEVYGLLVDVYASLKNDTLRQLAEANYQWYSGNIKQAKIQFRALLSSAKLDVSDEEKIKQKLGKK